MKSLIAIGESKSLTKAGDSKKNFEDEKSLLTADCLGNKENSENLHWGVKTWETSAGEMRLRIFNLLGNNSVGRMFTILAPLGIGFFRVFGLHWGSRSLTLMGILKLNSAGEPSLECTGSAEDLEAFLRWGNILQILALLRIRMMYRRGFLLKWHKDIFLHLQPISNYPFSISFYL